MSNTAGEKDILRRRFHGWSAAVCAVSVMAMLPTTARAWGVAGHRYANGLAVDGLPAELKPFYSANRAWIVEHSSDPDRWRNRNRTEAPFHFIDLDTWGTEAAENYPEDYWIACGIYGKDAIDKNGTVPWRIGQYYGKLVTAFKKKDARAIVEISTFLGHYVADIHVPFHAIANYDGQLSGQKGIHARFESVMVERQVKATDLKTRPSDVVKNPVGAAFAWARLSMKRSADVLQADKDAAALDSQFGDGYYQSFGEKTRSIAVTALEESGSHLAGIWIAAWQAAGKPELPPIADVHAGEPLDAPTRDPDVPAPMPKTDTKPEVKPEKPAAP
jgi:hypothetical protein